MELYQLRTFAAIAEEGHLTRAAERLHLSQPAVSGQIKALENEFEVRLFDRVSKGMELTTAGRELLAQASKVILAADALKQAARNLKGEITGTLRIGTVSDPHTNRVGELLSCALRRHPGLELELHHEMSGIALEDVRERKLDASFYFGDEPGPGFTALPLREVVYRVTAPAQWAQRVQAAARRQSQCYAVVVDQISGLLGYRMLADVAWRADDGQAHIRTHADRDHVFRNLVTPAHPYIEAVRDDVGQTVVHHEFDLDVGILWEHPG